MSSYNHSLPRIWGADFLYQHHMTWGSTNCLLPGHLSDLIAFMCRGSTPSLHLAGPAEPALPPALHLALYLPVEPHTPECHLAARTWRCLVCHAQNLFLSVPLGAAPYFPFSKWPCESQRVCTSGTYSDSPENPRLVTKSKGQRQLKHSKDKTLKDASQRPAISGLCLFHTQLFGSSLESHWFIFLPIWYFHLFVCFWPKLASFSVVCGPHTVPGLIAGFDICAPPLEHSLSCTDCRASGPQPRPRVLGISHPGREDQA